VHINSQKFATILFEKVAACRQRTAVIVATVIAPIAYLALVPCRTRGLFSVDANFAEMFRFQKVVMAVLAFSTVLTRRQVEESARRRLVL